MVPLNVDFYRLREELRNEVIVRIEQIEVDENPLDAAWLLYALSFENGMRDLFFRKAINELESWALLGTSGSKDKDLASLSLCKYLTGNEQIKKSVGTKIQAILEKALKKEGIAKFSVLNDPEQVFCVTLAGITLEAESRNRLLESIGKSYDGRLTRKALYAAALLGLREVPKAVEELRKPDNIEDAIVVLWFFRTRRDNAKDNILGLWKAFETIYPGTEMVKNTQESYLSNMNLALLYEAITKEIKEPDPNMLFDLHPEIKKIARDHFRNKKYSTAVFQAIQKLKELIEGVTGLKDEMEVELVRKAMNPKKVDKAKKKLVEKKAEEILIKFNQLKELSEKNEQEGLAQIAEGIFKAFRHPRGHKPEDHPLLELNPYEAIAQLMIIDYMWKRIEECKRKS
jgi:uncharacterized protein (TIGR02391 family)